MPQIEIFQNKETVADEFEVTNVNALSEEERGEWIGYEEVIRTTAFFYVFEKLIDRVNKDLDEGYEIGDIQYGVGKVDGVYMVLSPNRSEIVGSREETEVII